MTESRVDLVLGTREWLPPDCARLVRLEARLLNTLSTAGYALVRTPVLEYSELHERKSGAAVVSKLIELADDRMGSMCLRPELTASIVRAYVAAPEAPALPWRVCSAGVVFRSESTRPGVAREFTQVGAELLGAGGAAADAEVIALADRALRDVGIAAGDTKIRVGHLGLILELLERSGLPASGRAALVEILSEAAAEGNNVRTLETALERLSAWLGGGDEAAREILPTVSTDNDQGVDRLFRQLVPDVTGRRSGHEIIGRLRNKWTLAHSLQDVIARLRGPIQEIAELRGPAHEVIARLQRDLGDLAPDAVAELSQLDHWLGVFGIERERVELDLGLSRGIGFYSQMIFAIEAKSAGDNGAIELCGGGRYDGLARVLGSERDARGVGFAIGLERLASALAGRDSAVETGAGRGVLILPDGESWNEEAARLMRLFWDRGERACVLFAAAPGEALGRARDEGFESVVIVKGPLSNEASLKRCRPAADAGFEGVAVAELLPGVDAGVSRP